MPGFSHQGRLLSGRPSGESALPKWGAASRPRTAPGFTLLEVMIALGILGIALVALLGLHHQNLQSIIRARDMSRAAMLAQAVMTQAELERFPDLGVTSGDFGQLYPRLYPNFRWRRSVEASEMFPDIRKVEVTVSYGPRLSRTFTVTEFLHNPLPLPFPQAAPGIGPQAMPPPPQ